MKTPILLAALSTIGIQTASAACYTTGSTWPNRQQAINFVHDACYASNGMFTGGYNKGQTKSMCPRSNGLGLLFEVQNVDTTINKPGGIDHSVCQNYLTLLINGCPHGGEHSFDGYRYRADPGNC